MGGAIFGLTGGGNTSNNAPQPIPAQGNPGGVQTPSANNGTYNSSNLAGLSTGYNFQGPAGQQFYSELSNAYGPGTAAALWQVFEGGLFNPSVASAMLNAYQPQYSQGVATLENAFGAEGARFGSSAALGIGNYASQFDLNEQSVLANMYQQDQTEQLSLLSGLLPTLHAEQANKGGLFDDILGGLEIAGGIAAAPFTSGASLPLVGQGVNTLSAGLGAGGGGGTAQSNPSSGLSGLIQQMVNQYNLPGSNSGAGVVQSTASALQNDLGFLGGYTGQATAGADLGGAAADTSDLGALFGMPSTML